MPGIKVNLYRAVEVEGVALAARARPTIPIDCLMTADSYLMTHMGRDSTRLELAEQAPFLETMLDLNAEVAATARHWFGDGPDAPYILGDLPDGSHETTAKALDSMGRMQAKGAEAIKLETPSDAVLAAVEAAARADIPIIVHLGYTPQTTENRQHGASLAEALDLIARAKRARDAGASGLVLERVAQEVADRLCRPSPQGLPIHAIFSGWVDQGGQSLNAWDSTIRPDRTFKNFPPTATLNRSDYPARYSAATIAAHFGALLDLVAAGQYPAARPNPALAAELLDRLGDQDVWAG